MIRRLLLGMLLVIAVLAGGSPPPAHAQDINRQQVETGLFRTSIPGGDTIAQTVFAIFPSLLGTTSNAGSGIGLANQQIAGVPTAKVVSTLPQLVGIFNLCVMIITMVVITYQAVIWTIDIGREGKLDTQGSGMTALWSPVRIAVGLLLMVPVPGGGGWNAAQYAIGTTAFIGLSAGNYVWQQAVALSGTDNRTPLVPPINSSLPNVVAQMGMIELCRVTTSMLIHGFSDKSTTMPALIWGVTESSLNTTVLVRPNPGYQNDAGREIADACGKVQISKYNSVNSVAAASVGGGIVDPNATEDAARRNHETMAYQAHTKAVYQLLGMAQQMSDNIARAYLAGKPDMKTEVGLAVEAYMRQGVIAYASELQKTSSQILSEVKGKNNGREAQFEQIVANAGWTNAGNFFLTYTNLSSSASNVARNLPYVVPPDISRLSGPRVRDYFESSNAGGMMLATQREFARFVTPNAPDWYKAATGDQAGVDGQTDASSAQGWLGQATQGATEWFVKIGRHVLDPTIAGGGWNPNPIATMIETGHYIINTTAPIVGMNAIAGALPASGALTTGVAAVKGFFVGGPAAAVAAGAAWAIASTVAMPMLFLGILYAYIIPMIVWAMWATVVINWLMLLCEAMLVASLWGLAHARLDGESGFTAHAKHGYGVVFALVTRPIIGSIAMPLAILIYSIVVNSVTSSAYKYAVPAMTADHTFGPIGMVVVMGMVALFQVSLLLWCLNLPNVIFENLNAWVDMHAGPNHRTSEAVGQIASMGTAAGAAELTSTGGAAIKGAVDGAARRIGGTRAQASATKAATGLSGVGGEKQAPVASTSGPPDKAAT
jgi:conjugal transfer/type IV secretion protein DotA/TraY